MKQMSKRAIPLPQPKKREPRQVRGFLERKKMINDNYKLVKEAAKRGSS